MTMTQRINLWAVFLVLGLAFPIAWLWTAHAEEPLLHAEGQIELKSPPDTVWQLVGNFAGIDRWHPHVKSDTLLEGKNNEPLAVRQLDLGGGEWLISELLEWNGKERWFRYRILKSPLPVINYVGFMKVTATQSGGSLVVWKDDFRPRPGVSDADAVQAVQGVINMGLDNLPKALNETH